MTIDALLKHLADFENEGSLDSSARAGFAPAPTARARPAAPRKDAQRKDAALSRSIGQIGANEQELLQASVVSQSVLSMLPIQASPDAPDKGLSLSPRQIEEKISAAREEGRLQALSAARKEYEAKISEIECAHEENFESRQADWRRQFESSIGGLVEQAIGSLERELSEAVADVLAPLATKRQKEEILEKFCAAVRDVLCGGMGAGLVIEAPAEFVDSIALRSLCEGHFLDVRPSAGADIVARVDASVVRARFSEWGEEIVEHFRSAA